MARLPTVGGDTDNWGNVLNTFLTVSLDSAGVLLSSAVQPHAGLNITPVKTSSYNAVAFDFIPVDTTAGNITITLPTAPGDETRITVKMVAQANANHITVAAGGSDRFDIAGGLTSMTINYLFDAITFQYRASVGLWYTTANTSSGMHTSGTEDITGVKIFDAGPRWGTQTYTTGTTLVDGTAPIVLTDTTLGAFTVTLPASPSVGSWFTFVDRNNLWGTNNLTIGRNGNNIDGAAANLVLNVSSGLRTLVWDGTGWHTQNFFTGFTGNGAVVRASAPTFTGAPTSVTPSLGDNSTLLATTAFVKGQGYITSTPVTSVFARTGVITAQSGDYTAAQVTGAADKSSASAQNFTGTVQAPVLIATGLTGATSTSRYVGATNSGAPTSGTFVLGDFVVDHAGSLWICTTAGSPGTWTNASPGNAVNSVFGRVGVVTAQTGDYTAAQVTNAADKSSGSQQNFTAEVKSPDFVAGGLTGAVSASRYAGATASGAPSSGTFAKGDFVIDQTGAIWVCTTAGSPGTWTNVGSSTNTITSVFGRTGAITANAGDYTAAKVTNAADTSSSSTQSFTGSVQAPSYAANGLTGASQASRYVGATASGTPASGTFVVGDFVIAHDGNIFVCTLGGTPGTWTNVNTSATAVASVFGRTGAITAASGDYTAAQVSNAADKASGSTQTFSGNLSTPAVSASGLTGATAGTRYVGATASGAPASGTFSTGDFVISQAGRVIVCTAGGSPGTWLDTNIIISVAGKTGVVTLAASDLTNGTTGSGAVVLASSPTITGTLTLGTPLSVGSGGTGVNTLTAHGVLLGGASVVSTATGTSGQILRSGGASADPAWSTATFPATAGTAANVLRSDGTNFISAALAAADLSNGVVGSGAVALANSPTLTGDPLAPTAAKTDNDTSIATTAFTRSAMSYYDQQKPKLVSNVAQSIDGLATAWDIIQGVTPGRTGVPQTALKVTAPGVSWTLNIAAGGAHIQGTDDTGQGMYGVLQNTATTVTLSTTTPATNPRVDAIVIQYNDAFYTGRTPADAFSFTQVVGTPTAGATLANLNGAPVLPASAVLLAYVLVLTTDTTGVQSGNVLDARILSGPAVWGEDNHRYRLAIDSSGNFYLGQVA
jgi:hypothetical protein